MSFQTGSNLVLVAPVRRREWIIQDWFKMAEASVEASGLYLSNVVIASDPDDPSVDALWEVMRGSRTGLDVIRVEEDSGTDYKRNWAIRGRYAYMAFLRNQLLQTVRILGPDYCLSLDTDILLDPRTVTNLVESSDKYGWEGVGGKVYLSHNEKQYPSYANIDPRNKTLKRPDVLGQIPVDVIMAVKLMSPYAYGTDYTDHNQGEDIGWSLNCKSKGLTLGFDGRVKNRHIWDREHYEQ